MPNNDDDDDDDEVLTAIYDGCYPSGSLPLFEFVYVLRLLLIWRTNFFSLSL